MTRRLPTVGGLLAALLVLLAAPGASAHWADLSAMEITVGAREVHVTLTLPTGLLAFADEDRDGRLSAGELRRHHGGLLTRLAHGVRLSDRRAAGTLRIDGLADTPAASGLTTGATTHTTLLLTYHWPDPIRLLTVRYDLFLPGVPTASALTTVLVGQRVRTVVFTPEHREESFTLGRGGALAQGVGFIALGIRHILTGYDHVLFLVTLLMLGGSLRRLFKIVTAFTVAHSVTLSLAVFGIVALPPRLVESAIALSIAYVATENLWRREAALRSRWLVTFGFGLVHGLGFASMLRTLPIPRDSLAVALAGFNLGVEAGQVAIVAAAAVGLGIIRRGRWDLMVRRVVSAGAAVAGLLWFLQRALIGL